jgi:hypothetical protein
VLKRDDQGALAIIVALFATMIFILGALVVEAGAGSESRGDALAAADAGALAAMAVMADTGQQREAVKAAARYGAENNFPPDRTPANYFAGCTARVPSGWQRSGTTSCVSFKPETNPLTPARWSAVQVVTPQVASSGLFGAVRAPIRARAQAALDPGTVTRPPVMFGKDPGCTDTVRWRGIAATGDIHSNGNLRGVNGSVTGEGTYRRAPANVGATTWNPSAGNPTDVSLDENTIRDFPKAYSIADYRPGGSARLAAGADFHQGPTSGTLDRTWLRNNPATGPKYLSASGVLRQGIYYTTRPINITANNANGNLTSPGRGVVFVSDGNSITLGGNNATKTLNAYDRSDLLAFAYSGTPSCSAAGVTLTGSTSSRITFDGVIYAPSRRVSITTGVTVTMTSAGGSLEGAAVQHTSSRTLTLRELPDLIPGAASLHLQALED